MFKENLMENPRAQWNSTRALWHVFQLSNIVQDNNDFKNSVRIGVHFVIPSQVTLVLPDPVVIFSLFVKKILYTVHAPS